VHQDTVFSDSRVAVNYDAAGMTDHKPFADFALRMNFRRKHYNIEYGQYFADNIKAATIKITLQTDDDYSHALRRHG
jgi:hypothetical protein